MDEDKKTLRLRYHGRIIDQLGIQMYQSPVAAVAELIANAWDADAEKVEVTLPRALGDDAELVVRDNGLGMTFEECQERYLNVGYCRRGDQAEEFSPELNRPVLGRKGIGKLAGFGIAQIVEVETVSKDTGERTVFAMDINQLRKGEYVEEGGEVALVASEGPDLERRDSHGTIVRLKQLKMRRTPSQSVFLRSMANKFLLLEYAQQFKVYINEEELPQGPESSKIEFVFPRDYKQQEKPDGLDVQNGWGIEELDNGERIKWRINFYKDTIGNDEFQGISVFSGVKMVQKPFFFNLSGGLGGQHGQTYMSGQVKADFIDRFSDDIIAPERQRVNWEHEGADDLLEWGRKRTKHLLRIWQDRRGEKRRHEIDNRLAGFSARLQRLQPYERRTVDSALKKLGSISSLDDEQFTDLGNAMLTAWEKGRLRELIDNLAHTENINPGSFLKLLVEADVLSALNAAEVVKTKLENVRGLRLLVDKGELENAVRDYVAKKPYLLDPKWETFKKETSVKHFLDNAAQKSKLDGDEYNGRIDLALKSGGELLIVEFMRPGLTLNWDHVNRCVQYVEIASELIAAATQLQIEKVTGLLVADKIGRQDGLKSHLKKLSQQGIFAFDWMSLLNQAEQVWRDFLFLLADRNPDDGRLQALKQ